MFKYGTVNIEYSEIEEWYGWEEYYPEPDDPNYSNGQPAMRIGYLSSVVTPASGSLHFYINQSQINDMIRNNKGYSGFERVNDQLGEGGSGSSNSISFYDTQSGTSNGVYYQEGKLKLSLAGKFRVWENEAIGNADASVNDWIAPNTLRFECSNNSDAIRFYQNAGVFSYLVNGGVFKLESPHTKYEAKMCGWEPTLLFTYEVWANTAYIDYDEPR